MADESVSVSCRDEDAVIEEIRAYLGFVPLIYRELRDRPSSLAATWDEHRRVLLDDPSGGVSRCCIALATAAAHGCRYWVDFHTAMLRRAGVSEADLDALLAAIRFASGTAALANGMGLSQSVDPELLPYLPHRGRPL
jgi:AhpD family alkylhydroperoxidase